MAQGMKGTGDHQLRHKVVQPKDPSIYWDFVSYYCKTPVKLRVLDRVIEAYREKSARDGRAQVPSATTLNRWAVYGVKLPGIKPTPLKLLAEMVDAGEFDLETRQPMLEELQAEADATLKDILVLCKRIMANKKFEEKCIEDPKLLASVLQRVNEVSLRISHRVGDSGGDLSELDREGAIAAIAGLLERFPDIVPVLHETTGKLLARGDS